MISDPRRRLALLLAVALMLGWLPTPAAEAFYPHKHFAMFKEAIGSQFNDEAQTWVNEGLERNDVFPEGHAHPEWHFDSANSPAAICDLWMAHDPGKKMGPNKLLVNAAAYAVEAFRPGDFDPSGLNRVATFRRESLIAYGQYLHAIQDFYTHSNWIELHVNAGTQPGLAPIQAGCDATALAALQPKLQSGYFDIYSAPADFCGGGYLAAPALLRKLGFKLRPPAGFDYCHGPPDPAWYLPLAGSVEFPPELYLAKDVPDQYHGKETFQLPGGPVTSYHAEAARLATLATTETLQVLHDRVVAELTVRLPDRDPECLFQVLLKGGDAACPKRVGLGTLYQGAVAAVDDGAIALWANLGGGPIDEEYTRSLRNVRVTVQFDMANVQPDGGTFITGGSLSFEFDNTWNGAHYVYTASAASGMIAPVAGGYDGWVEFTGTATETRPDLPPRMLTDEVQLFGLAVDPAGQPVLCQRLPLPTLDGVRQYRDCLARAVVRLQPAPSSPPIA